MSDRSIAVATAVLLVWLCSSAFAFWWFQFRQINNFQHLLVTFDGSQLATIEVPSPASGKYASVMYFTDPACPCSKFSVAHLAKLKQAYAAQADFINGMAMTESLGQFSIPVTPSVAIWSAGGELAYFGPFSGGAVCGEGDDFVAFVLARLKAGLNPEWFNLDTVGCFCASRSANIIG